MFKKILLCVSILLISSLGAYDQFTTYDQYDSGEAESPYNDTDWHGIWVLEQGNETTCGGNTGDVDLKISVNKISGTVYRQAGTSSVLGLQITLDSSNYFSGTTLLSRETWVGTIKDELLEATIRYADGCIANVRASVINKDNFETLQKASIKLQKYIDDLNSYEYGSDEYKKRILQIREELLRDPDIDSVELTKNGTGIWVEFISGFDGIIASTPISSKGSLKNISNVGDISNIVSHSKRRVIISNNQNSIGNNKVLALMAQYWDWGEHDDVPLISNTLKANGYDVTEIKYNLFNSGSIEDFKNWDKYGIILLSSHGEASKTKIVMHTNSTIIAADLAKYQDDIDKKRIVLWGNSYGVTQEFINKYNSIFPNSLVYMSICKGAQHNALAKVFTDRNAGSYIGYTDEVGVSFVQDHGVKLFNDLLKRNSSLKTAFVQGIKETDSTPAEMKLFGFGDLSIQLVGETETLSNAEAALTSVINTNQSVDGYFVNYGKGAFDWIYIIESNQATYKLEGITPEGDWIWQALSFSSVLIDTVRKKIIFGNAQDALNATSQVANKNIDIAGYFIHYGQGGYDWIYTVVKNKASYKLDGLSEDGKFVWSPLEFKSIIIDSESKSIGFFN